MLQLDYIQTVIGNARRDAAERIEERRIASLADSNEPVPEADRSKVFEKVVKRLRVDVQEFIKYLSDPPDYRIRLRNRRGAVVEVSIGDGSALLKRDRFAAKIQEAVDMIIPSYKNPDWDNVVSQMNSCWTHVDVSVEATERGETHLWVNSYLKGNRPHSDLETALPASHPFIYKDIVYFSSPPLKQWIRAHFSVQVTLAELSGRLKSAGYSSLNLNIKHVDRNGEQQRPNRNAWTMPV